MKILLVNKFWYPHGGADRYALWLADALRAQGYEVVAFSLQHEQTIDTPYPLYTIPSVQTERLQLRGALRTVKRMFWSAEARRALKEVIARERPDIAHIHNVYTQMSPSVLPLIHDAGIPSVMTVHDYHLVSANYALFDRYGVDTAGTWSSVVRRRGIKDSWLASALAATVFAVHKHFGLYHHHIDRLVFTSQFVQQLFHFHGWEGDAGVVVPLFAEVEDEVQAQQDDGYFLFVGRLHETKGVHVLIEAARQTGVPVKIVGEGSSKRRFIEQAGAMTSVEFLGTKSHAEVLSLMRRARAVVVPSVWWEPFGLVSIEAQALSTPVVASNTGGLRETVVHGQTGYLVEPNSVESLAAALSRLSRDPEGAQHMGRLARRRYEAMYTSRLHMKRLLAIYNDTIEKIKHRR